MRFAESNDVYAVLGTICVLALLAIWGMWRANRQIVAQRARLDTLQAIERARQTAKEVA